MMCVPYWLLTRLRVRAERVIAARPPDFAIGPAGDPYMLRWYLVRTRFGGAYLHLYFHDDDDRALHDHPWPSLSIMLRGVLRERFALRALGGIIMVREADSEGRTPLQIARWIVPGDVVPRSARFAHRLIVPRQNAAPLTLFIFGPRIRRWGFWCPRGWRHWREFVRHDATGEVGRGCGD